MGVVVVEEFAGTGAVAQPPMATIPPEDDERGALPVAGLLGLVGGAAFAFWTSLTCFVC